MLDANVAIAQCIQEIYRAADPLKPARVGTWAGRMIPRSDGTFVIRIRVSIDYPSGEQRFAPLDCTLDATGRVTSLKEHHE